MLLIRETYIHNRLVLEEEEKTALRLAENIISKVCEANSCNDCAEDTYLKKICDTAIEGISELLNDYCNEYPPDDGS